MNEFIPYRLKNGMSFDREDENRVFEHLLSLRPHKHIDFPWNDIGLGNLFADCFSDGVRFCVDNQKWYIYNEGIWTVDKGDVKIHGLMQKLLLLLGYYITEIKDDLDEETYKTYKAYIHKCSSDNNIKRAISATRTNLPIEITQFDADPYLLNCTNGVYDLRKQTFRFARPEDYFTLSTAYPYPSPLFTEWCDRWYSFIDEITEGDKEKAAFLQRALGYSLLGINKEECMFVAYGQTRCGKGTLFNSIAKVLGSGAGGYGGTISPTLICESKYKEKDYNAAEPMLADTVGVRYLTMSETKSDARLDETSIKSLTGRDPRKTRQLHSLPFIFTPQFTIWLMTNFLPKVNDDSVFKSDRIWVVEFNKHFDEGDRDTTLKETFDTKQAQMTILKWLIDGYRDYVLLGLNPPACVREATDRYARMNDRIRCFVEDCLEEAPGERASNAAIYSAYKAWCMDEERGYNPRGSTSFYKDLNRFYQRIDSNGFRGFADVRLKRPEGTVSIKTNK